MDVGVVGRGYAGASPRGGPPPPAPEAGEGGEGKGVGWVGGCGGGWGGQQRHGDQPRPDRRGQQTWRHSVSLKGGQTTPEARTTAPIAVSIQSYLVQLSTQELPD